MVLYFARNVLQITGFVVISRSDLVAPFPVRLETDELESDPVHRADLPLDPRTRR